MLTPEGLDGGSKQGLGAEGAGGCCLICFLPLRAHVELGGGVVVVVQREHADSGVQKTLAAAQWAPPPTLYRQPPSGKPTGWNYNQRKTS